MATQFTEEWLELEEASGGRACLHGTPEEIISQFNALIASIVPQLPPPDPAVKTTDGVADGIPYRIYTPIEAAAKQEVLPVGVYMHGGGFICGSLDSEDPICRAVAHYTPCIVVSVEYRMGTKYKLPVMLDDSMTLYKWARRNASSFGGDQSKFFTIGGSAGGGLALSVANQVVKDKKTRSQIQGVVAVVPLTLHWDNVPDEYKSMYKAYEENATNVPVIDRSSMESFYEAVNANPKDSDIFTALSPNHKYFPPTYICTCGADPLRDDGTVIGHALTKAGVKTKLDHYPGLPHYFWIFPQLKAGEKFMANLIAGTQWAISSM